jgi:diguanylate cyclase (GGDEF)-like protein
LGAVLVFRDITESRRIARKIAHDATHDALTGLVNRGEFQHRLECAVASSREYGAVHALCYLDLDQFKVVNDTAGHSAGDDLLKHAARLLAESLRERDTLARLGGDEFGLLLQNCPQEKAVQIAETLIATLRGFRFAWEGRVFRVGMSIGLVPVTAAAKDAGQLLTLADVACYTAKDLGRNRVHVYQTENSEPARRHREILRAANLRDALEADRFLLVRQAIVPLSPRNAEAPHYEFLIRLKDVDGNILPPGSFIPPAERYGLMTEIDRWVIRTVLHRCAETYAGSSPPQIAINLSGNSLDDQSLLDFVQEQFARSGFPAERVCFEITETAAIHHFSNATRFMKAMKASGCRFALDDFGSGVSSFTYLKKLPVDYLKIDGNLVKNMVEDPTDQTMVAAINQIGHAMSIKTIAEYVQDASTAERLKELGVDYGQGYALGSIEPM